MVKTKVIGRNQLYCVKDFRYRAKIGIKKKTIIQIKEIFFYLPTNINLYLIS